VTVAVVQTRRGGTLIVSGTIVNSGSTMFRERREQAG
jgi:hypothetical protein